MDKINLLNTFVMHPSFIEILEALKKENIRLPQHPSAENLDFAKYSFPVNGKLKPLGKVQSIPLRPENGQIYLQSKRVLGYDESIDKFQALEGAAYLTSHSLVMMADEDYIPSNYLTFYFYTRSQSLLSKNKIIKDGRANSIQSSEEEKTDAFESAFKKDYAQDRTKFILERVPNNCILLIDGPLIGAQMSRYTIEMNKKLIQKNVIPIYFVKNSSSNLVTDNITELKGKFNSDMHWAYNLLGAQERTNFFQYSDQNNADFSKMFCYIKQFDMRSPQRVEIHSETYAQYKDEIYSLLDLVSYLLIAHGDTNNPQVRPISIAEQFARKTIKLYNIHKLMQQSGITPSMNEVRFR